MLLSAHLFQWIRRSSRTYRSVYRSTYSSIKSTISRSSTTYLWPTMALTLWPFAVAGVSAYVRHLKRYLRSIERVVDIPLQVKYYWSAGSTYLLSLKARKKSDQPEFTRRNPPHFWQLRLPQHAEKAQASKVLTVDVPIVLNYLLVPLLCDYWVCYSDTTKPVLHDLSYWFV